MAASLLAFSFATAPSYTAGSNAVVACLGYVPCLAAVKAESLVISLFALLRVDLGSVEVHAIYIHYVNVLCFTALVDVVMVVSCARLLHILLVDCQLVDYLDPQGKITMVRLRDLAGNQLLQVYRDPLFECSHMRGMVLIVHGG
jgi:hypothetical protein